MKRSKHTLSHYRMVTANLGELFPVQCVPVLPGDTFQGYNSGLIRVSPLNTPVMHPVSVRYHSWFVPNRLVNPDWEEFITGGDGIATPPTLSTIATTADKKSLLTYLGLPPIAGVNVQDMPVRACNLIFNTRYRDQDAVAERAETDITPMRCAWEKDYFTTARPWTQKGPAVTLPVGDEAPVVGKAVGTGLLDILSQDGVGGSLRHHYSAGTGDVLYGGAETNGHQLIADLSNAQGVSIDDFRAAFSLQRYQEARARYGSRFTEYLRYLGINPSDARLQEPEFLGGGTSRLNFSEVLQTTPNATSGTSDADGVGDLYGHGIAGVRTPKWRKFFEEHGYVITFVSLRPKALYLNGIPRDWLKTDKEDYFQRELANLGQQEIDQLELHAGGTPGAWGFQDRYEEYRYQPSQVTQDFRDTLNSWHMARDLTPTVALNEDFIECDPAGRIFQVDPATADSLWIMNNNHLVARRMVPKRANPRII